jgi:YhcH/YjgK/YiaL family protein
VQPGRYEIVGDEVFAIIEDTTGRGREASPLEYHRRYIDIQYVVSGEETFGWSAIAECNAPKGEFDSSRDIGFYNDQPSNWVKIPAGYFAIFFPEDCHAPLAGDGAVQKIVIKVAQSLEQMIEDLHAELVVASQLHPEKKEQLQKAIQEIQQLLDEQQSVPATVTQRLRELTQELELTHPRLTFVVGRVADALSQMGI